MLVLQWFYNAKSVFLAVNASLGWLNNVSGLILSLPTIKGSKAGYILTTMNEKMVVPGVLFVKVASYWSVIMVLSTFLQLSNVKPTRVCSAPARPPSYFNNTGGTSKGIMTSILPLKMSTDYGNRTKAYRQSVSLYCATKHYKANLCWYLPEEIFLGFF